MYLTEISHFPSFSHFRVASSKPSLPKNFDLISRSFDENLLRRLKTLNSTSDPPSISLSWLSLAVDFLSSTHAEAQLLISNLGVSSSSEDSLASYLDDAVKLLDACNSITLEIERLRQRRLLINFVLQLLDFSGEGALVPAPEKLRRARDCLSDWDNYSRGFSKRSFQNNPEVLIRDLAVGLGNAPRGKISSVGKLIRRTIYAVGLVTVFVAGAVASALCGLPEPVRIRVPAEFAWADSFNDMESAISEELKRRCFGGEKKGWFREMDDVGTRVKRVCDVIDDLVDRKETLETAVKELETATETFGEGLDRLSNGVNAVFDTVLCTRNGLLDNFRGGLQKHK
ncbi:hypothetical protein L1049_021937 [Liquidambar formosana]|uniref:Uncharacterized protein n=1 Tax=Liquidambar formosana TaxID=63359 RepID=A0AAP0RBM4_LIQFO